MTEHVVNSELLMTNCSHINPGQHGQRRRNVSFMKASRRKTAFYAPC